MCAAYKAMLEEIFGANKWMIDIFLVAKRLEQTRDFYILCKAALYIPFPKTVP